MTCLLAPRGLARALLALAPWLALSAELAAAEPAHAGNRAADNRALVDYAADVAPILGKHCGACHGPDNQESGLRVDRRASLLRGGDLGAPAITPGKAETSLLIEAVTGRAADLAMPPEGDRLSAAEIATLRAWIDAGAPMPPELSGDDRGDAAKHWSFQPLARVAPPGGGGSAAAEFVAGPIDALVLAKLAERGLRPSEEAERRVLIRRLYLVMHGLPPTLEQTRRFVADAAPDAWPRLVEEVLASPRYGERWARHWLDLVRFGETHGFETNQERPHAWPYRDYVIAALNADKPFDQFAREQLAGDALGAPAALGFLVGGPYDVVKGGGDLAATQRMNELDDMIQTTSATFLGLTVGCARCHNHKFDPITQTDYYALQAVFAGVRHGDAPLPPSAADLRRLAELDAELADWEDKLAKFRTKPPAAVGSSATAPGEAAPRPPVSARHNVETFAPTRAKFIRFTIEKTNSGEPCLDELEVYAGDTNLALASRGARASASGSLPGYDIHKLEHVHDGKFGNARSWICDQPRGWVQIELAEAAVVDRVAWARDREGRYADRLAVEYRVELAAREGAWTLASSSRDRAPFAPASARAAAPALYFDAFPAAEAEQGRRWLARRDAARQERQQLQAANLAYIGNYSQPGVTRRLHRGEHDKPREAVGPGAVAVLANLNLPADAPEPQRRLALARWIASPDNPLTARVVVNRLWQQHFGEGLVDTPSDFGANGTKPTHPELLDWLAGELRAHDWSLKRLHRLILNSRVWRQDSRPRAAELAADGGARWLWRFPPRRLEAEALRDAMLATSGVLDLKMGGPGFSAFEIQRETVRHYFPKESHGPDEWRRMIYMTKVRQEQEAVFGAFDCPDGGMPAPKRGRSTTPLQAFNLFNSPFALRQAELFAERLAREAPEADAGRAALAHELALGRPAAADEAARALAFAAEHGWPALCRALFNSNEFAFVP